MPACPHRGRTSGSCSGCRTATPRRSRPARSRSIAWVPSAGAAPDGGRPVRDGGARCCRPAPGSALAGADRDPGRPAHGAPALRGDARRPHAHRACERGARRSQARSRRFPRCRRSSAAASCCRSRCWRATASAPSCSRRRWRRRRRRCRCGSTCSTRRASKSRSGFWAACRATTTSRVDLDGAVEAAARAMRSWSTISARAAQADGWMHTLVRYEDRRSGHAAETSFGAHIFNTR